MKFAHEFMETLSSSAFPPEWASSAIQYKQLKKCIKRVQKELQALGLDVDMLKDGRGPVFEYMFDGTVQSFHPKLVVKVDESGGLQVGWGIDEEARRRLEELLRKLRRQKEMGERSGEQEEREGRSSMSSDESSDESVEGDIPHPHTTSEIEIPLFADVEFFHTLTSELESLDELQTKAKGSIETDIISIGDSVARVATPKTFNSRSDLYPWREVFRLYLETSIFFSTQEIESYKERTPEEAEKKLQVFENEIERLGIAKQFKCSNSKVLLEQFMGMNQMVLRVLRFQAINKVAMRKILKKFDKRTALGAAPTFPLFISTHNFLASQLARALCFTMSTRILSIIPQLDDYLCPICQYITIKPVRLACSHVFCVRCLVKLQREYKSNCPMCRNDVVLKADASNIDPSLLRFLKCYFPKECREKQRVNEREVVREQWMTVREGKEEGAEPGCAVM
ncbi:hypothetical protein EX30DRAFT_100721 [Ascodesmis nigricans]|uniref:RING-14 protein n=1 Tax=Ascodesmis nigricans TaxID=341454 RepID=A0A4S2N4X2_9PEZI|nr:hypothetical protein EX30DRAFT_100721 [Ascodesmis nigricans]